MDGLTLLAEARGAGLTVERAGERMVIRGPRRAEALARRMIERKADVLAALDAEAGGAAGTAHPKPTETDNLKKDGGPREMGASATAQAGDASAAAADRFADWVLRPDVDGRLGWESPRLTEDERWWAWIREDQLPVVGGRRG